MTTEFLAAPGRASGSGARRRNREGRPTSGARA